MYNAVELYLHLDGTSRSQLPRGVRHEMSSPARTLVSWVRIHSKHGYLFFVYTVFLLGSGLVRCWSPVQGVLPTVLGLRNWSGTKRFADVLRYKWAQREYKKKKRARTACFFGPENGGTMLFREVGNSCYTEFHPISVYSILHSTCSDIPRLISLGEFLFQEIQLPMESQRGHAVA
jgi:hypothetical protein